jgi:hypothetical protein
VHWLPSLQSSGVPAVQVPAWQVSVPLQSVPSRQGVPSVTGGFWQPRSESQLSAVQTFPSSQFGGGPPIQIPLTQESAVVQASESLQLKPSLSGWVWQTSSVSLHTPWRH